MATSKLLLSLSILLSFLSFPSSARPCKTLFISSYSLSIKPHNPNPNHPSSGGFLIVTEIQETSTSTSSLTFLNRRFIPVVSNNYEHAHVNKGFQETASRAEMGSVWDGFGSYDLTSLRDRTKDILSVVVALLFGVGCGALTAATMYLVWSLFSPSQPRYGDYFDGDYSDDEVEDVKKIGYVKIPEAEQVKGGSA